MINLKQHEKTTSVASRVGFELESDEYYRKAISLGIANLSAIAEKLAQKLGCGQDAAKIAVARWARENNAVQARSNATIVELFSKSAVSLHDSVAVIICENSQASKKEVSKLDEVNLWSVVYNPLSITLVCTSSDLPRIERALRHYVLLKTTGLCLIHISSPKEIERISGAYVFLLDAIARKGINVLETFSCYTETNIVVARRDSVACFQAVEQACGKL